MFYQSKKHKKPVFATLTLVNSFLRDGKNIFFEEILKKVAENLKTRPVAP